MIGQQDFKGDMAMKLLTIITLSMLAVSTSAYEVLQPETSAMSVIDHDGQNNYLYLGNGYNSDSYERKQFPCVHGNEVEAGNVVQKVFATHNLTFEQARNIKSGMLSVGVSSPTMTVGANAEWAYEVASSAVSQSINMTVFYQPKKRVIIPSNPQQGIMSLTSTCQNVVDNRQDLLLANAGNEFVTSINSVASLSVTMKIESTSTFDRDFLAGAMKFSRTGIYFNGDLSNELSKLTGSSYISINIHQLGGDPNEVLRFGANNGHNSSQCASIAVSSSNGDHLAACMQLFNDVMVYARTDFKQQLLVNEDYAITSYNTSKYETSGLDQLLPNEPYELVTVYREMKLSEAASLYKKSREDLNVANFILADRQDDWPESQLQPLRDISQKALNNSEVVYDILTFCEVQPYGTNCVDKYNTDISMLEEYDDSYLLNL